MSELAGRARRLVGWERVGLRGKLLVPFLLVPLIAVLVSGCLTWWVSDWAAERSFDRALGDKLEIAVELLREIARERLDETRRLARAEPEARAGAGLELLAVKRDGQPLSLVAPRATAETSGTLAARLDGVSALTVEPRFALVASERGFLAVAAAPLPSGDTLLVTGRRMSEEILRRFTGLSGIEMGVFAGWQRAAVSSFGIDLARCQECHDSSWRVHQIAGGFHLARSFKGQPYFATSLGDGFRYAFMPLALGGQRIAMIVVRQPLTVLAASRRQTLAFLGGGAFLAFVVSLGAWWGLSRHVSASITALQRWMESILEGKPAPAPMVVRGEVDRLATSLSTTVAALRDSRDHLDRVNGELLQMVDSQVSAISTMRERLGTFLDLAQAPERVPESDEVAREMLRHVCQLFAFSRARMIVLDHEDDRGPRCLELAGAGVIDAIPFDGDRDPVLLSAARRSSVPFHLDPSLTPRGMQPPVLVVPVTVRGQTLGVLALAERRGPEAAREPDLETLDALVHQGAMALEHSVLLARAQETYLHTTGVLVTTIESKDPYLRGHSDRVASMSVGIASRLGIQNGQLRALELLARFHDVGKVCIDSSILLKPSRLTADEFEAIKRHVEIGEAIVSQITSLREHAPVVGQHHERWDGNGYVRRVAGEDIRLEARIIAVSDAFDAMTSARPYRPPADVREAVDEIVRGSGRQFDPTIADIFQDLVLSGAVNVGTPAAPR